MGTAFRSSRRRPVKDPCGNWSWGNVGMWRCEGGRFPQGRKKRIMVLVLRGLANIWKIALRLEKTTSFHFFKNACMADCLSTSSTQNSHGFLLVSTWTTPLVAVSCVRIGRWIQTIRRHRPVQPNQVDRSRPSDRPRRQFSVDGMEKGKRTLLERRLNQLRNCHIVGVIAGENFGCSRTWVPLLRDFMRCFRKSESFFCYEWVLCEAHGNCK